MTATALTIVLIAAGAHAVWNLAAKRVTDGGALFVWLYYSLSILVCLPVALGWFLVVRPTPQWTWVGAAVVTAVLHIAYAVVLQRGYAAGDMSIVYPTARGIGPLLAAVIGVTLLEERPGTVGLVGGLLVISGVAVIGSGGAGNRDPHSRRLGVFFGVATGCFIAGYTLWDAHAVSTLEIPPLVYFTIAIVLQSTLMLPRALAARRQLPMLLREHSRKALIVAVLSPLSYLLVLYAMRIAPVSLIAPARETSIVLGSILGLLVLREGNPGRKLTGSLLVTAGIVAIGLT